MRYGEDHPFLSGAFRIALARIYEANTTVCATVHRRQQVSCMAKCRLFHRMSLHRFTRAHRMRAPNSCRFGPRRITVSLITCSPATAFFSIMNRLDEEKFS